MDVQTKIWLMLIAGSIALYILTIAPASAGPHPGAPGSSRESGPVCASSDVQKHAQPLGAWQANILLVNWSRPN